MSKYTRRIVIARFDLDGKSSDIPADFYTIYNALLPFAVVKKSRILPVNGGTLRGLRGIMWREYNGYYGSCIILSCRLKGSSYERLIVRSDIYGKKIR